MDKAVSVFTFYAKDDEPFVEDLTVQLSLLRRKGILKDYFDKEISPAESWDDRTRLNFADSDYLLFLVSPSLLNSGYYQNERIQKAFSLAERDQLKIIPVLIRDCDLSNDSLSKFQLLPLNGPPVDSALWGHPANAWKAVSDGLRAAIAGEPLAIAQVSAPPVASPRKGMSWAMQLLLFVVGLAAMGAISYYVINYEPGKTTAAVGAAVDSIDSNNIVPLDTMPVPTESEEDIVQKDPPPKSNSVTKTPRPAKRAVAAPPKKDTVKEQIKETVEKEEPPPPAPKTPSIKSAELEQMLFDFSQGKGSEADFSGYLCNQLQTQVRFDKKQMTFSQMCAAIKEVKAKKIKKIAVLSLSYDNSCISGLEVSLKKKGLFN